MMPKGMAVPALDLRMGHSVGAGDKSRGLRKGQSTCCGRRARVRR